MDDEETQGMLHNPNARDHREVSRLELIGIATDALASLDAHSSIIVPDFEGSSRVRCPSGREYYVCALEPLLDDLELLARASGFAPNPEAAQEAFARYVADVPPDVDYAFFGLVALVMASRESQHSREALWIPG